MRTIDYDATLAVRVPTRLLGFVIEIAKAKMLSKSEYLRQALIFKIQADGIDLKIK
jgi:hypothetical protein